MLIQELPCLDSNIAGQLLLIEFATKSAKGRHHLSRFPGERLGFSRPGLTSSEQRLK
jgi:hypothetical protein